MSKGVLRTHRIRFFVSMLGRIKFVYYQQDERNIDFEGYVLSEMEITYILLVKESSIGKVFILYLEVQ
jgi:hypothetical protein